MGHLHSGSAGSHRHQQTQVLNAGMMWGNSLQGLSSPPSPHASHPPTITVKWTWPSILMGNTPDEKQRCTRSLAFPKHYSSSGLYRDSSTDMHSCSLITFPAGEECAGRPATPSLMLLGVVAKLPFPRETSCSSNYKNHIAGAWSWISPANSICRLSSRSRQWALRAQGTLPSSGWEETGYQGPSHRNRQ